MRGKYKYAPLNRKSAITPRKWYRKKGGRKEQHLKDSINAEYKK